MPDGSDVTNDGCVQVADEPPAGALAAGLLDPAVACELVLAFGITAIFGPAATCGIAVAALPAPPPVPPMARFLTSAWRAPPPEPPPVRLTAARPPAASTAQAAATPMIPARDSGISRFPGRAASGEVSASCLAMICRTGRDATQQERAQHRKRPQGRACRRHRRRPVSR